MKRLTNEAITERLSNHPGWDFQDNALQRELVFDGFRSAISFLVLIAFDAEALNHHPDVTINFKRLNFSVSTHSEGGVTDLDFRLIEKIDRAYATFSSSCDTSDGQK